METQKALNSEVAEAELSDLELLAQAAQEAEDAHLRCVLGGPGMDEVQLHRAARRARRRDARRLRNTQIAEGPQAPEGAIA